MNADDIKRRLDEIQAERDRALYGTPPGADDDLDGDVERPDKYAQLRQQYLDWAAGRPWGGISRPCDTEEDGA